MFVDGEGRERNPEGVSDLKFEIFGAVWTTAGHSALLPVQAGLRQSTVGWWGLSRDDLGQLAALTAPGLLQLQGLLKPCISGCGPPFLPGTGPLQQSKPPLNFQRIEF